MANKTGRKIPVMESCGRKLYNGKQNRPHDPGDGILRPQTGEVAPRTANRSQGAGGVSTAHQFAVIVA
jgi:hypothetical protein